jgi:hypothetical protein
VRRAACHARVRVPTHARTPVPVRERRSLKLCLTVCCDPEGRYEGIGGKARAAVEALLLAVVVYLLLAEAVSLTPHSVTRARGLLGGAKGFPFPHPADEPENDFCRACRASADRRRCARPLRGRLVGWAPPQRCGSSRVRHQVYIATAASAGAYLSDPWHPLDWATVALLLAERAVTTSRATRRALPCLARSLARSPAPAVGDRSATVELAQPCHARCVAAVRYVMIQQLGHVAFSTAAFRARTDRETCARANTTFEPSRPPRTSACSDGLLRQLAMAKTASTSPRPALARGCARRAVLGSFRARRTRLCRAGRLRHRPQAAAGGDPRLASLHPASPRCIPPRYIPPRLAASRLASLHPASPRYIPPRLATSRLASDLERRCALWLRVPMAWYAHTGICG